MIVHTPVVPVQRHRDAEVIDTLIAAFDDDPVMRYALPSSRASWAGYFNMVLDRYRAAQGAMMSPDGQAAALWAPPGLWDIGLGEGLRLLPRALRVLGRGRLRRGLQVMRAMHAAHPPQPHWYLNTLGVHPAMQNRGLGAQLLEAGLALADHEGVGAYLESSNERNLVFYRRHGFEIQNEVTFDTGVRMWMMWREARR